MSCQTRKRLKIGDIGSQISSIRKLHLSEWLQNHHKPVPRSLTDLQHEEHLEAFQLLAAVDKPVIRVEELQTAVRVRLSDYWLHLLSSCSMAKAAATIKSWEDIQGVVLQN